MAVIWDEAAANPQSRCGGEGKVGQFRHTATLHPEALRILKTSQDAMDEVDWDDWMFVNDDGSCTELRPLDDELEQSGMVRACLRFCCCMLCLSLSRSPPPPHLSPLAQASSPCSYANPNVVAHGQNRSFADALLQEPS